MVTLLNRMEVALVFISEADPPTTNHLKRLLESCEGLVDRVVCAFNTKKNQTNNTALDIVRAWCIENNVNWDFNTARWTGSFADARNEALKLVKPWSWMLLLDTDEEAHMAKPSFDDFLHTAGSDNAFAIPTWDAGKWFPRANVVRYVPGLHYEGRIHEFLVFEGQEVCSIQVGDKEEPEKGPHIIHYGDGPRTQAPDKHVRDAEACLDEYEATKDARYLFYAGQSFGNCRKDMEAVKAYAAYLRHQGGWPGMVYLAHLNKGRAHKRLGQTHSAHTEFLRGYESDPARPECPGELATLLAEKGDWPLARVWALACHESPNNSDHPDLSEPVWKVWRAEDVLATVKFNLGDKSGAVKHLASLTRNPRIPETHLARIQSNLNAIEANL